MGKLKSTGSGVMLILSSISLGIYVIGGSGLEYNLWNKIVFYLVTIILCLNIPALVILPKNYVSYILLSIGLFLLSTCVCLYDLHTWILFALTTFATYLYSYYKRTEITKNMNYSTAYHYFFLPKTMPFLVAILIVFTILYILMFSFFKTPFRIMGIFEQI